MHYKNGREAKNGDKVVCIQQGYMVAGILHSINPGSDTCNGRVSLITTNDPYVNIKECLHADDVANATIPDTSVPQPPQEPAIPPTGD